MISGIATFFEQGGIFMYPILLMGIVAAVIGVERFIYLFRKNSTEFTGLLTKIRNLISKGNVTEALRTCEGTPGIYSDLMKAGISRSTRDEQQIQNAIDVQTMKIVPELNSRLGHLSMIANVATLLGLLGTINGLIQAFAAVAQADPALKQTLLANGISVAMNTTEFGLMIAIPTMLLHGWLSSRARKLTVSVSQVSTEIIDSLSGRLFEWMEQTPEAAVASGAENHFAQSEKQSGSTGVEPGAHA